jgi:hypothetical protein
VIRFYLSWMFCDMVLSKLDVLWHVLVKLDVLWYVPNKCFTFQRSKWKLLGCAMSSGGKPLHRRSLWKNTCIFPNLVCEWTPSYPPLKISIWKISNGGRWWTLTWAPFRSLCWDTSHEVLIACFALLACLLACQDWRSFVLMHICTSRFKKPVFILLNDL